MHHLNAALRAHTLFHRDQHYVVQNGEVIIVDEFTGRLMPGRRWSDGLHQAVEAKEGVEIQRENQTLRLDHLPELLPHVRQARRHDRHRRHRGLRVPGDLPPRDVVIPTHRPMIRKDLQDQVYRTLPEKYDAIVDDIKDCHARGQPVLVGTTSIENSELLSDLLKQEGCRTRC